MTRPTQAIGYVVNTYPRASHSFIRREIAALERAGWEVRRFAMRGDPAGLADPLDREEHRRTERVLDAGPAAIGAASLGAIGPRPAEWRRLAQATRRHGPRHAIYMAEAAWLARRVRALGLSHLHAHFGTNSTDVARHAARMAGIGYSFTVHGPEEFDAPLGLSLDEKLADARFAVAISSFGRGQLCRWVDASVWPRIHVVRCGIDPDAFSAVPALPEGPLRLVAIGRFAPQKGFPMLLSALALARQRAEVRLTLVGGGEMEAALRAQAAALGLGDALHLPGWQDEAGVRAAIGSAHAVVSSSFAEGLPVVLMEGMALGRPALATAIAGVPELVVEGETGWLVPSGDEAALAEAMVALAGRPRDELMRVGAAARARVLARHDVTREAAKLGALFSAVLGQATSAS